jgi:hypothetical protein
MEPGGWKSPNQRFNFLNRREEFFGCQEKVKLKAGPMLAF